MHYSCDWPLSGWRAREQVKRQLAAWSQCTTKLVFTPPVNPSVCVCMRWQCAAKGTLSIAFQSCPPPHHALPTLSFSPGTGFGRQNGHHGSRSYERPWPLGLLPAHASASHHVRQSKQTVVHVTVNSPFRFCLKLFFIHRHALSANATPRFNGFPVPETFAIKASIQRVAAGAGNALARFLR